MPPDAVPRVPSSPAPPRYGLVRLHHGDRGRVCPEVPYQAISLGLAPRA